MFGGQALAPVANLTLTAAATTAVGVTSAIVTGTTHYAFPSGPVVGVLVANGAGVRYRDDGGVPTPTVGIPINPTQPFEYNGDIRALQVCAVSGTVSVAVALYRPVG